MDEITHFVTLLNVVVFIFNIERVCVYVWQGDGNGGGRY